MKAWLRRARPLLAVIIGVIALTSCDEKLESGLACPLLCPTPSQRVRDTTFFAVDVDSSLPGYPAIGTEPRLVLAAEGDTFDARGIVRFDSLPTHWFKAGADSQITQVDGARLTLHLAKFDTAATDSVTYEVYDVDAAGDDTAAATLVPAFVPSRLLGSTTVSYKDSALRKDSTIVIPLDSAKVLARIRQDTVAVGPPRLRTGIRVTSAGSTLSQVYATNTSPALGPLLSFLPSADSGVARTTVQPRSTTPAIDLQLRNDLADFQLVAISLPPLPPGVLRVGGVPGWRTYLHFDIPASIIDSSDVVRASLFLTQRSNPEFPESADTFAITPHIMTASSVVTDIYRVLTFMTSTNDSLRLVPKDSGLKTLEVVNIVRPWKNTTASRAPRAIGLTAFFEGARSWAVEFYSNEAPDSVRPRIRLTYVPPVSRGVP